MALKRKAEEMEFNQLLGAVEASEAGLFGRFAANFRPKRMCNFYEQGTCQKGDACTFAHSPEELHPDAQMQATDTSFEAALALQDGEQMLLAGEEVSFLSSTLGPRDFTGLPPPKMICRSWLHHPTYCLQGDNCPQAHGLSEMGLDDKPVTIRSGAGPTAKVTVEDPWGAGGMGADGMAWGPGKGGPGKDWWMQKGGYCDKGFDKGFDKGWGDKGYGKGYDKGYDKGGYDMGYDKGFGCKGFGDKGFMGKGCAGKGWMQKGCGGKSSPMGQMALPSAAAPGESRFAHKGGFMPTKLCNFWVQDPGACKRGDECTFAHGHHELQSGAAEAVSGIGGISGVSRFHHNGNPLPTKMCTFFANNACSKGVNCTYAHSEDELAGAH